MMYDLYIMKRTQIYLEELQAEELARRSGARGVTASHLIREAITQYLSGQDDEATELARQRANLKDAFAAIPRLPSGARYVDDIRQLDETRDHRLEQQWRTR